MESHFTGHGDQDVVVPAGMALDAASSSAGYQAYVKKVDEARKVPKAAFLWVLWSVLGCVWPWAMVLGLQVFAPLPQATVTKLGVCFGSIGLYGTWRLWAFWRDPYYDGLKRWQAALWVVGEHAVCAGGMLWAWLAGDTVVQLNVLIAALMAPLAAPVFGLMLLPVAGVTPKPAPLRNADERAADNAEAAASDKDITAIAVDLEHNDRKGHARTAWEMARHRFADKVAFIETERDEPMCIDLLNELNLPEGPVFCYFRQGEHIASQPYRSSFLDSVKTPLERLMAGSRIAPGPAPAWPALWVAVGVALGTACALGLAWMLHGAFASLPVDYITMFVMFISPLPALQTTLDGVALFRHDAWRLHHSGTRVTKVFVMAGMVVGLATTALFALTFWLLVGMSSMSTWLMGLLMLVIPLGFSLLLTSGPWAMLWCSKWTKRQLDKSVAEI